MTLEEMNIMTCKLIETKQIKPSSIIGTEKDYPLEGISGDIAGSFISGDGISYTGWIPEEFYRKLYPCVHAIHHSNIDKLLHKGEK